MPGGQDSRRHSLLDCHMANSIWALEDEEIAELLSIVHEQDAHAKIL